MYSDYVTQKEEVLARDIRFVKMHGLGNDFVIIDQRDEEFKISPQSVRKICDRNFGIGCDQLIILRKSDNFDCQMLIFNPDGSIARACGNACRCVGKLLDNDVISIQIHDRVVHVKRISECGNSKNLYSVDMGTPLIKWYEIPLRSEHEVMSISFDEFGGKQGSCINIGNPHLVFFENQIPLASELTRQGPFFENHSLFPDRTNVSFAEILDPQAIKLKVWERGTGLTFACGSAACATHFIAYKKGMVEAKTKVIQEGGELIVEVSESDSINMIGEASYIFSGVITAKELLD